MCVSVCVGGGRPEDPDVSESAVTDLEFVGLPASLLGIGPGTSRKAAPPLHC